MKKYHLPIFLWILVTMASCGGKGDPAMIATESCACLAPLEKLNMELEALLDQQAPEGVIAIMEDIHRQAGIAGLCIGKATLNDPEQLLQNEAVKKKMDEICPGWQVYYDAVYGEDWNNIVE